MESSRFHVLVASRQDFCFIFQKMNELEVFVIWFLYKKKKYMIEKELFIYYSITLKIFPPNFSIIFGYQLVRIEHNILRHILRHESSELHTKVYYWTKFLKASANWLVMLKERIF